MSEQQTLGPLRGAQPGLNKEEQSLSNVPN